MSSPPTAPTRRCWCRRRSRDKDATYINVSAAPHTWPIIEAQGFSRYCDGVFVAVPMLKDLFGGGGRARRRRAREPDGRVSIASEQDILLQSCRAWLHQPVVRRRRSAPTRSFSGPRLVKRAIPCAQLIYCRDIADFVRFAGPIGRYLARRGRPFVIIDSNGAHTGSDRHVPPRQHGEIFQGPATAAPGRPRLHRIRGVGRLIPIPTYPSPEAGLSASPAPCAPRPANAADRGRGSRTAPRPGDPCRRRRSRCALLRRPHCADSTSAEMVAVIVEAHAGGRLLGGAHRNEQLELQRLLDLAHRHQLAAAAEERITRGSMRQGRPS